MPAEGFSLEYDNYSNTVVVNAPYGQGFEDYAPAMGALITKIMEIKKVPKITVVAEGREYFYSDEESQMLFEIANLAEEIRKQELVSRKKMLKGSYCEPYLPDAYVKLRAVTDNIIYDPVMSYRRIIREGRMLKHKLRQLSEGKVIPETKGGDINVCKACFTHYLLKTLLPIRRLFEHTAMIKKAKELRMQGRQVYRRIFNPSTRPTFMYTRLETSFPENAELIDKYKIGDSVVSIFRIPGRTEKFYHIISQEFNLGYEEYDILEKARRYIGAHEPSESELAEPELFRKNMFNLAVDLIRDISSTEKRGLGTVEIENLANILAQYTTGIGIIETLLMDEKIQDISINAPVGRTPVFVRHADHGDCVTNIYPSPNDAESWATRFRIHSGRPLDEANPVLDTELEVKGGRARVAAITRPLSPDGLAFALRRFRSNPWTFPLFINTRMLDAFSAGLIWFLIDGARTMLIAGTRSSGKCVDGNSLISVGNGGIVKIRDLVESHMQKDSIKTDDGSLCLPNNLYVTSLGEDMKIKNHKVKALYKRKAPAKLIKITTATGKNIITTQEHIYFSIKNGIREIKAGDIREGEYIASARTLPHSNSFENFDLEPLRNQKGIYAKFHDDMKAVPIGALEKLPEVLRIKTKTAGFSVAVPKKLTPELAELLGYIAGDGHVDSTEVAFFNTVNELTDRVNILMKKCFEAEPHITFPRNRSPMVVIRSKALSNIFASIFGFPLGKKSENFILPEWILQMGKENTKRFIRAYFDCDGTINVKRGIEFATASRDVARKMHLMLLRFRIISFLKERVIKGKTYYRILISGENVSIYANEIGFLHPKKQARLQSVKTTTVGHYTNMDSVPRIGKIAEKIIKSLEIETRGRFWGYCKGDYFFGRRKLSNFVNIAETNLEKLSELAALQKQIESYSDKIEKLAQNVKRQSLSDREVLAAVKSVLKLISHNRLVKAAGISAGTVSGISTSRYKHPRFRIIKSIGRGLQAISKEIEEAKENLSVIKKLANSDILWEKIIATEIVNPKEEFVYDIEVEGSPNFVSDGIIAHNTSFLGSCMVQVMPSVRIITTEDTLELPVNALRNIGYNIVRLKSRSVITHLETELPAEEALRTALRLGDSALILGEVRSREALALYEAMRIGALANVVAGTIHGESAYGVFDRVVNDLGVPPTSFKATDIIIIANMLHSPDGMRSFRRIVEITEVRKHWQKDPMQENGFVPLMEYNASEDKLKPTQTLLTGESEIINNIASRVKEWRLDWESVWDNINLRAKVLGTLADEGKKEPALIEADFVKLSNSMFHTKSYEVLQELGTLDSAEIFRRWNSWLRDTMVRM